MATYLALVEIADVGYGVVFPDCPGCTAMVRSPFFITITITMTMTMTITVIASAAKRPRSTVVETRLLRSPRNDGSPTLNGCKGGRSRKALSA